jgi:hypothetical protein
MTNEVVLCYTAERHGFVAEPHSAIPGTVPVGDFSRLRRYDVISPSMPPLRRVGRPGTPAPVSAAAGSVATASPPAPPADGDSTEGKTSVQVAALVESQPVTYVIKTPAPIVGATGTTAATVNCPRGLHPMHRVTLVPTVGPTADAVSPMAPADQSAAIVTPAQALALTAAVEKDEEKLGLLLITLRVRANLPFTACAQCSATTGVDVDATGASNAKYTHVDDDGSRIDVPPPPPQVAPRAVWVCLRCEAAMCDACCEKKQLAAFVAWGANGGGGAPLIAVTEATWRGPGARVCRGPSWQWHDQDGGEGGVGTVVDDVWARWITVRWEHDGTENGYRVTEEEQDLCYC